MSKTFYYYINLITFVLLYITFVNQYKENVTSKWRMELVVETHLGLKLVKYKQEGINDFKIFTVN